MMLGNRRINGVRSKQQLGMAMHLSQGFEDAFILSDHRSQFGPGRSGQFALPVGGKGDRILPGCSEICGKSRIIHPDI